MPLSPYPRTPLHCFPGLVLVFSASCDFSFLVTSSFSLECIYKHLPNKAGLGGSRFTPFFWINTSTSAAHEIRNPVNHSYHSASPGEIFPLVGFALSSFWELFLLACWKKNTEAMFPMNRKGTKMLSNHHVQEAHGSNHFQDCVNTPTPQPLAAIILRWLLYPSPQSFPVWLSHSCPQW